LAPRGRDAGAAVQHLKGEKRILLAQHNGHFAAARRELDGVDQDVQQGAAQGKGIGRSRRQRIVGQGPQRDAGLFGARRERVGTLAHHLIKIHRLGALVRRPGEKEELLKDLVHARHGAGDAPGEVAYALGSEPVVARQLFAEHLRVKAHGRHRVAEIVQDAVGQHAGKGQVFLLAGARLAAAVARDRHQQHAGADREGEDQHADGESEERRDQGAGGLLFGAHRLALEGGLGHHLAAVGQALRARDHENRLAHAADLQRTLRHLGLALAGRRVGRRHARGLGRARRVAQASGLAVEEGHAVTRDRDRLHVLAHGEGAVDDG